MSPAPVTCWNLVGFEITETAAIANFLQASRFILALKELVCKFALDDFGTGFTSFGYLTGKQATGEWTENVEVI